MSTRATTDPVVGWSLVQPDGSREYLVLVENMVLQLTEKEGFSAHRITRSATPDLARRTAVKLTTDAEGRGAKLDQVPVHIPSTRVGSALLVVRDRNSGTSMVRAAIESIISATFIGGENI